MQGAGTLIAELAETLGFSDEPLDDAADLVRERFGAHRVSIARFDEDERTFRVMATSGAQLCAKGTTLPVATSSHYAQNTQGQVFAATNLRQLAGFDEACDKLILSAGIQSGFSIPLHQGRNRIGAIHIASFDPDVDYAAEAGTLAAVGGMLTVALARETQPAGPSVVVLHDDPIVAEGLARLCETGGAARTITCGTVEEAVACLQPEPADIVICDNYIAGKRVDEVAATLRRGGSGAALLVVASHDTGENVDAAVNAGAAAYVPRPEAKNSLAVAIATIVCGRTLFPARSEEDGVRPERLTVREREVLVCLEEGLRLKQIALRLAISEATAKTHARNVFRKLDATSRHEAVREARRQGFLA